MKRKRAVVAFGGNALIPEHEEGTDEVQARHAEVAARTLADLVKGGLDLLVVHGNGPQVGNILIQMEEAENKVPPSRLDICVAMSQGAMGYLIARALRNQLARRGVDREVVTLVTEVLVDEADAAFAQPTKPVGPFFSRYRAKHLMERSRWTMVEDSGRGWRKVVPSPRPIEVLNAAVVAGLIAARHVVIAGGGGGVPVCRGRSGRLEGIEAVIDKDYTAALLAREIQADTFIVLTSVPHILTGFGTAHEKAIHGVGASEMRRHLEAGEFGSGSMEPKVRACLEFLDGGGHTAVVTEAPLLKAALRDKAGTRIHRDRFA